MLVLIRLLTGNVFVVKYSNAVILKDSLVFDAIGLHGVLRVYGEGQDYCSENY
jgi:hypothetical protein